MIFFTSQLVESKGPPQNAVRQAVDELLALVSPCSHAQQRYFSTSLLVFSPFVTTSSNIRKSRLMRSPRV